MLNVIIQIICQTNKILFVYLLGEKRNDLVNVQVVRGKTTTFIHLDDEEAKKVWTHGDAALKRVQQVHKSVAWNFFIGRASLDGIQKVKCFKIPCGNNRNILKMAYLSVRLP